ncbi:hypothetical protein [Priestia megaterium]|uniref:hypothetical protein n=1 Tax=Priestia megaterium TaxID=1404 RepID=UPI002E1A8E5C|nr:hypothetical protein [Priestia megaterium]
MAENKRGRKSCYESHIQPRFDEIKSWLESGATEREVAKRLGIAYSSFNKYKATKKEFMELLKSGRDKPVEDIKAAMFKRATGFQYEEKKVVTQAIEFNDPELGKIPAKLIRTEVTTKTALPDVAAGLVLLKHWDEDAEWTSDPQTLKLKKKELELKEKTAEQNIWMSGG